MESFIVVLDNELTLDRFTIINKKTGDVWGCSDNPFAPHGIAQFSHNIADNYWNVAYGYSWRKRIKVNRAIKDAVNNFMQYTGNIGKRVPLNTVPDNIKKYISQVIIT